MICISYGTRPEFIKLIPLIKEMERRNLPFTTLSTGQHESMLDDLYQLFEFKPDKDLEISKKVNNLSELNGALISETYSFLSSKNIKYLFVQGDTASTFCSGYAGFLNKSVIFHLEAGLRTENKYSPWPEEVNRRLMATIADIHLCATKNNKSTLLRENIPEQKCHVVGNTIIDAVKIISEMNSSLEKNNEFKKLISYEKSIVVTGHRRENWGDGIDGMCAALRQISKKLKDYKIIFCTHPNPTIRKQIQKQLSGYSEIIITGPQRYDHFIKLMNKSDLIISDSGGIQEEVTALGKYLLITRDTTERQEAVDSGHALLVGTNPNDIYANAIRFLNGNQMKITKKSPFGDGNASEKILDLFQQEYEI